MKNKYFEVKNDAGIPVIHLTGEIGEEIDYSLFRNAVLEIVAKGYPRIRFVLNCIGGDMVEGFAMYDYLLSLNITREVNVIGMAASMGGVFAQVASKGCLGIHQNALIMIHKPQTVGRGESSQLRTSADLSDKLEKKAKQIYVNRGIDAAKVDSWFVPGTMTWFTAEEALAEGLVDYIIWSNSNDAKPEMPAAKFKDEKSAFQYFNKFIPTNNLKPNIKNTMNKLLVSVVLMLNNAGITNVNIDSTEDEVVTALNKFSTSNSAKIQNLENTIKNSAKTGAVMLIEGFVASGKLPSNLSPDDKNKWIKRAEDNPEAVSDLLGSAPAVLPNINDMLDKTETGKKPASEGLPKNKAEWSYSDWEKNDSAGLKNMLVNNKAEYTKLFKAEYGIEPF